MSIKATRKSLAFPRRDFTLCKATLLAELIGLGFMAGHIEAAADGDVARIETALT